MAADAGLRPRCFPVAVGPARLHSALASYASGASPLKSRRDDMKVAQGKRGTSAALGKRQKMFSPLFSNLVWCAWPAPNQIGKKRHWVRGDVYPGQRPPAFIRFRRGRRRPCPGLPSCRPSRGSGDHINGGGQTGIGPRWANHRLQARPGFAWPFVLSPRPGLPEPERSRKKSVESAA